MVITRQIVGDKLLSYLNGTITLSKLVDWAENTFVDDSLAPDEDIDMLNDILAYLAAADTSQFPLTWDTCVDFMKRLGVSIKVVAVDVA